ncbi:hypothetical protein L5515_011874 [Caenorhabditis briggsae]|uniref:Uncharacterized protein n=1 Tax=Caenorhabditis briggsae TaxID=6238 RepID=A0AAE9ER23_CAEBR|nr:hypothetical protein L5515_011874 [Caenorhabditis briggsae]
MKYISSLLLLSSLFGSAIGCLPGLGLGGGGGGCCSPAQPACGNPCGGGGAAPAPVYAAAPLAPAPFAAYPQAPAAPFHQGGYQPQQPQYGGANGGFQQPQQFQQVQGGYAGAHQGANYGSIQTGAVSAGGAYQAEPAQQVQPLPLLGQPVAYEKSVIVALTQQQEQVLSTAQVLTKVMPASAVLDEHVAEPAVASPNNIVTSINTQTSYGDEHQTATETHNVQPQQQVLHRPAASSSSSSSSSASSSAEHHPTHQVRVPSASSSIESNKQRVVPESVIVKEIVQSFETTTPYPKQVALQTVAPFVPQPAQPVQPQVSQPVVPHVPSVSHVPSLSAPVATSAPFVPETFVEPVQPVQTIQPIQPAPIRPAPLQPAHNVQVSVPEATQAPTHSFIPETKVVAEEDRIEATGGSDYDQPSNVPSSNIPSNIPSNEQATVNELLASLDSSSSTPASNLDFNQVTIEPNTNQQTETAHIQTDGDDYDSVPLNEDRKDVPTAEPTHNAAPSNPQPVAVVPEETAPIIPQQIQPIETYQPQGTSAPVAETTVGYVEPPKAHQPEIHLQPVAPAVRVEATTTVPAPTIKFELPIEVHEVVTPQVPLQPEPAVIQTITEEPIAEVTVEVLPTSAAPVSQFFENITSREENHDESAPTQPEPSVPAQTSNGADYDEKSVENKVSTETEVVPNLGEYGSKFAKVQGAETKQVSEPIQIETIENANPYGRKYWIF